ncbi:MAG: hypoxanthine phosphoribosyltransferase [Thermodesulfobacteriota bacterium]|nr:hypoxanthine phosphoribosyltransferase [Thermodesulfobacteriota bacterium]
MGGKGKVDALKREVLIPEAAIRKRVREIADQISNDYKGTEPLLVGILKGSIIFMADLMRALSIPVQMDFMRAASYGSKMASSGTVRVTKDIELPIQGKPVILIEDIVDSGLTLAYIKELLEDRGAASLKICALIDKRERREQDVSLDYCGFQIKEGFLVGYGLDCNEEYRNLPEICVLKE